MFFCRKASIILVEENVSHETPETEEDTMKAMLIGENQELILSEVENPVLKPEEVLVEIYAAGMNRADLLQRAGNYPSPPGCPPWMGLEISGVIREVGPEAAEKSHWKVGDKVCALLGGGGYAEYVAVKYDMLLPIPAGFSMEEAACIPEVYATAYLNLMEEAKLQKDETILIHAGGSGVGIAATQIAKAHGSRVIATVRSDEKAKIIEKFGADRIVNTKITDERTVFEEETVNVVLDCVGGTMLGECFSRLAKYGRWIMIATLGGVSTTLDLRQLLTGNTRLIGSTLRSRTPEKKAEVLRKMTEEIYPYFEKGAFRPEIYCVFPFENAEEAQQVMQNNQNIGKLVLRMKTCD